MAKMSDNTKKEKKETVNTTDTEVSKSDSTSIDWSAIAAQIEALQTKIEKLQTANTKLREEMNSQDITSQQQMQNTQKDLSDKVKIRFNAYAILHAELPSINLRMTEFGETRTLTLSQFQELIGLHPDWFKNEYLLVDASRMDLMEDYPVTVYDPESPSFIHPSDIKDIGKKDTTELREYYDKLSPPSQRGFVTMWMRKCYDRDPDFYTIEKMEAINSMSNSKTFSILIRQLNEKQGISEV